MVLLLVFEVVQSRNDHVERNGDNDVVDHDFVLL